MVHGQYEAVVSRPPTLVELPYQIPGFGLSSQDFLNASLALGRHRDVEAALNQMERTAKSNGSLPRLVLAYVRVSLGVGREDDSTILEESTPDSHEDYLLRIKWIRARSWLQQQHPEQAIQLLSGERHEDAHELLTLAAWMMGDWNGVLSSGGLSFPPPGQPLRFSGLLPLLAAERSGRHEDATRYREALLKWRNDEISQRRAQRWSERAARTPLSPEEVFLDTLRAESVVQSPEPSHFMVDLSHPFLTCRKRAECQLFFLLGVERLISGDVGGASSLLNRAVATNMRDDDAWLLATAELRLLDRRK